MQTKRQESMINSAPRSDSGCRLVLRNRYLRSRISKGNINWKQDKSIASRIFSDYCSISFFKKPNFICRPKSVMRTSLCSWLMALMVTMARFISTLNADTQYWKSMVYIVIVAISNLTLIPIDYFHTSNLNWCVISLYFL